MQDEQNISSEESNGAAQLSAIGQIDQYANEAKRCAEVVHDRLKNLERLAIDLKAIANRAKLLALNAAIEASRTEGEGKGFGVVAEEIKILANQADQGIVYVETCILDATQAADANSQAVDKLHEIALLLNTKHGSSASGVT